MTDPRPLGREPQASGGAREQRQRVAAYCLVVDDQQRILLVQLNERTTMPGAWTLPGGGIDFGEDPADAAIRELDEETGYAGELDGLLGVHSIHRVLELPSPSGREPQASGGAVDYHAIRIVYRAHVVGGELRHEPPGNSSQRAEWHPIDELGLLRLVDLVTFALAQR